MNPTEMAGVLRMTALLMESGASTVSITTLLRELANALACPQCHGTGRKVVGEHETLSGEWVSDTAPCLHTEAA